MEGVRQADSILRVRGVSKKFCRSLKTAMLYELTDLVLSVGGIAPATGRLRRGEFWAVREAGFELGRGRILGVVGANGSGKTTLLRLLAGVFPLDSGEIEAAGRLATLISPDMGFTQTLTARENIHLAGALLGMRREEILAAMGRIREGWGFGDALDAPVGTLSAGMYVRLGFSVISAFEPELLIVDEILAFGDSEFRQQCQQTFDHIARRGSVVIVSHDLAFVEQLCTDLAVMDGGRIVSLGSDVRAGLEQYRTLKRSG